MRRPPALARAMGSKDYKALAKKPIYDSFVRGLTFTWFVFTLFWFWVSWTQIARIFWRLERSATAWGLADYLVFSDGGVGSMVMVACRAAFDHDVGRAAAHQPLCARSVRDCARPDCVGYDVAAQPGRSGDCVQSILASAVNEFRSVLIASAPSDGDVATTRRAAFLTSRNIRPWCSPSDGDFSWLI
jgi:hypothetical protein